MRFLLFSVLLVGVLVGNVVSKNSCDKDTECGDDETCCKLSDRMWGCCPMPRAICCEDRTHCCPSGTTCDQKGSRCVGADDKHIPMKKKRPATKTVERNEFNEVLCPDKASKCPDGSTCCLLEQGTYGCCPVPNAVCCPDMLHCCPNGFTCHGEFCSQNYAMIPHLRKFASTSIHRKIAVDFLPEDSDSSESTENPEDSEEIDPIACGTGKVCPAQTTCCNVRGPNGTKKTMCCPLSNAVCCQDTCCPAGYHCVEGGKCEKHARAMRARFWNTKQDEDDEDII